MTVKQVSVAVLVLGVFMTAAQASLWGSYTDLSPVVNEPMLGGAPGEGNPNAGQDIIAVGYGESSTHHYFMVELEAAPAAADGGGILNYAGLYGVYIDADNDENTGFDGTAHEYVPNDVYGIEYILDSHFDPFWGGWHQNDFHDYTSGSWVAADLASTDHEENGAVLEWAIAKSDLSGQFKFWVASHDEGSSAPTYDLEGGTGAGGAVMEGWVIPEPASAMLMAAVSGFGLFIRRRFFI